MTDNDTGLRERVAMALMAVEHVGKSDLKHHPLEWHWRQRFDDIDRDEYRALADAAISALDAPDPEETP